MISAILLFIILSLPLFSIERRLPLNIWFPSDWRNSEIGYWMAYTFVIIGVIFAMVATFFYHSITVCDDELLYKISNIGKSV